MDRNLYQSVYGRVSVVILRQAGDETRCRYAHVKKCRAPTRHPTVHRHAPGFVKDVFHFENVGAAIGRPHCTAGFFRW